MWNAAKECYDVHGSANNATTQDGNFWDYLYCAEMLQPMSRSGVDDMFWPQPFDLDGVVKGCEQGQWKVTPRPLWATVNYGGQRLGSFSNIVWSNGELDPWRGGGVTRNISDSLHAIVIPQVGHHIDLMFSDARDPPAVSAARDFERSMMRKWVDEVAARHA